MTDKKADIWMPLWIGAYLADTMKLTTIQHGAYFLLLIAYWRERKPLADVDDELRSITKLERAEWRRVRPVLSAFFKVGGGVWWHKRVEAEIAAADTRSKKASAKAAKAAQARWDVASKQSDGDASGSVPSMPQALLEDMHEECPPPLHTPLPPGDSVPDGTDAAAASAANEPPDSKPPKTPEDMARADLWRAAVAVLQEGGCKSEPVCRSFMGKLVKDYGLPAVTDAVAAAASAQPADAREYLKATCQRMAGEHKAATAPPTLSPDIAKTRAYLDGQRMTEEEITAAEAARLVTLESLKSIRRVA